MDFGNNADTLKLWMDFQIAHDPNWYEIYMNICMSGNSDMFRYVYEHDPRIHDTESNETLVELACSYGTIEMMEYILDYVEPLDIHAGDERIIRYLCGEDNFHLVKQLIWNAKSSNQIIDINANNEECFTKICEKHGIDNVKYILEYAESINSPININASNDLGFRNICASGTKKDMEFIIEYAKSVDQHIDVTAPEDENQYSAFVCICLSGDIDALKYLLECDEIDIHEDDEKGFKSICSDNSVEMLEFLLKYAESIDSPIDIHAYYEDGFRSICKRDDIELLKVLFDYSVLVDSPIDIHALYEEGFARSCVNSKEMAQYLAEESLHTNIKYLFDSDTDTGYVFGSNETDKYNYHGTRFYVTRNEPDYDFLDKNAHKLMPKKSAM